MCIIFFFNRELSNSLSRPTCAQLLCGFAENVARLGQYEKVNYRAFGCRKRRAWEANACPSQQLSKLMSSVGGARTRIL